ncbi:MAG: DNA-binding protein [Faecousia sp.]
MQSSTVKGFNELPDILNGALIARTLGISLSSAYKLMNREDFPSFRLKKNGKNIYAMRSDFAEWVEAQARKLLEAEPYI